MVMKVLKVIILAAVLVTTTVGTMAQARTPFIRLAFFVDWDPASLDSLKANLGKIDMVAGEWLNLSSADGDLNERDFLKQKQAVAVIGASKRPVKILALVNNYYQGGWQSTMLAQMLEAPIARQKTISGLLNYVKSKKLTGVNLDFESIPLTHQPHYLTFLKELTTVFHRNHLLVTVDLPIDDPNFNYREISKIADYLILMAYDEHWSTSQPGPIASLGWIKRTLDIRKKEIPPRQLIIALGNYGYDWKNGGGEAASLTVGDIKHLKKIYQPTIFTDPASQNPTFGYQDSDGYGHSVWFLNSATFLKQLKIIKSLGLGGVGLWRLGSEGRYLWEGL